MAACWSPRSPAIGMPASGADALAVDLAGGTDLGEHRLGDAHDLEDLRVPVQGLQVHQHGAAGVGHVGHVEAAVDPTGEVPDAPGVDVAEGQVTGLRPGRAARRRFQQPADLGAGEVGCQGQADLGPEAVLAAVLGQLVADGVGAGVLPDDGVVHGLAGLLVPDHRGLALVGDAHRGKVRGLEAGLLERAPDHLLRARPRSPWRRARPSPASGRSARALSGRCRPLPRSG